MTGIEKLRRFADSIFGDVAYMRDIADQIERETLPRPLFEDGEPVQFGDGFIDWSGCACVAQQFEAFEAKDGLRFWVRDLSGDYFCLATSSQRVKRPEPPDSWERLEADVASGDACRYFGVEDVCEDECRECTGCPAHVAKVNCGEAMAADVLRRCKALTGVE